ncbi:MAG: riboflavin kinase, partial [Acidobacteriaceae bacterium]
MKIYRSLFELPAPMAPTVAAIGNFDGVHRGHQEVIGRVLERARGLSAQAIAVTFDPHPMAVLHPERAPKLITPMPQRLRLLEETGLDATVVLPFTREFSLQSAREFAEGVLCRALRVAEVHEGDTFRFGHDAAAGIAELRELGRELGFGVISHGALRVRGVPVSSSEVRKRIAAGQLGMARALLGRTFSVDSTAARGRGVGTKLTTPTIILAPYSELLPPHGVYVTRVRLGEGAG